MSPSGFGRSCDSYSGSVCERRSRSRHTGFSDDNDCWKDSRGMMVWQWRQVTCRKLPWRFTVGVEGEDNWWRESTSVVIRREKEEVKTKKGIFLKGNAEGRMPRSYFE